MANAEEFDVDAIIDKLLEVRGARPGKEENLPEDVIITLLAKASDIFMSQPVLLNLSAPLKVCGLFSHRCVSGRRYTWSVLRFVALV